MYFSHAPASLCAPSAPSPPAALALAVAMTYSTGTKSLLFFGINFKKQSWQVPGLSLQPAALGVLIGTARLPSGEMSEQPDLKLTTSPRLK